VWKAVRSGWLTQNGEQVKLMESNIAKCFNLSDSTLEISTVSNGTHALHLALLSLDVRQGDLVGIPDFCYVAVANAVLYCGATPVLLDVEIETTNISLTNVTQERLESLKAIVVVDNYGIQNNLPQLRQLIKSKVPIIYDVAESFPGCNIDDELVGSVDVITGSFYANKVFTSGEGGFIGSSSARMTKIRKLKNQGQASIGEFKHDVLGFNYRITNIQAAIFNAQWKKYKKILAMRRKVFMQYEKELNGHPQIEFINKDANPWLVAVRIFNSGQNVEILREKLQIAGVETRPGFQSFHKVKYIAGCSQIDNELSNSALLSRQIICLPTFPHLRKRQIKYVCQILVESLDAK
jgi:perosamine synthetase